MQFQCTDDVGFPVDRVYSLIRDDMTALIPYLKDVDEIRVIERKEEPGGLRLTNLWRGSASSIPSVAQKFVSADVVTWTDHAFWPKDERRAEWRLEPRVGGRLFECSGTTSVLPGRTPGTCQIQIRGELHIYPERLPGVPRLLARTIRGTIEGFVVKLIVPNLQIMAKGVQGYFSDAKP
jgi:hypothetical protein